MIPHFYRLLFTYSHFTAHGEDLCTIAPEQRFSHIMVNKTATLSVDFIISIELTQTANPVYYFPEGNAFKTGFSAPRYVGLASC